MPIATTRVAQIPFFTEPDEVATISADGRWLAFETFDLNGKSQVFLQNLNNGTVNQAALPPGGVSESTPVFSADGNKLAFKVRDNSFHEQIYIQDLHTNQLQLGSSDAHGMAGNKTVYDRFSLSGDGRYLVFSSVSDNLVAGDTNGSFDVYVKDLSTGAINLVSSNSLGQIGNGASLDSQISRDGHSVVFRSTSTNLLGAAQNIDHLYIKDLQSGSVRFVDTNANGTPLGVSSLGANPVFSADGSKVAFHTYDHAYVKDLASGSLTDPASRLDGTALSGSVYPRPFLVQAISADGRYVTFTYSDNPGLAGDGDNYADTYQKDLQTGKLLLLTAHGARYEQASGAQAITASDDGHTVLFVAKALGFGAIDLPLTNSLNSVLYVSHIDTSFNSAGNDALIATSAADRLAGGNGDDSYWIDNAATVVAEADNGGTDTVYSLLANFSLPDNVENLILGRTQDANVARVDNANGTGNALGNQIAGNNQNNVLRGLDGNDLISGGGGNDTIDGGAGIDIALFRSTLAASNIAKVAGGIQVSTGDGVDLLQNVERIQFSDQGFSLPGDTHAAQAYRIYQAAFNRTPDAGGLGFWIKQIDNGATLDDVAHGFMQSAEFKGLYGTNPANATLVEKFYQNVLHRAPDAGGFQYWTDLLNHGLITPEHTLAEFSESPENQAALTGVVNAGFAFTLFN